MKKIFATQKHILDNIYHFLLSEELSTYILFVSLGFLTLLLANIDGATDTKVFGYIFLVYMISDTVESIREEQDFIMDD